MDSFKAPLRYPGGKRTLYKIVSAILRENALLDGHYVEPYAGGAGLAIELLLREQVQHIYLNDADPHIFAFWYSLLDRTDDFVQLISSATMSVDEWRRQRAVYLQVDLHSTLDVGFSTFFLNRCNRSGILGGRPVGGLDQSGPWKIDARFHKKNLIHRIETIALYRDRIHIFGLDAEAFLKCQEIRDLPPEKTLIYLDPPYYVMGRELYLNNYRHADHLSLSYLIKLLAHKWLLSYDSVPEIRAMYQDRRTSGVSLYYRANARKMCEELMVFSDDLKLPPHCFDVAAPALSASNFI